MNIQSDVATYDYDNSGKYAKVMEIPIGMYGQQLYINTFSMLFRVYWINCYNSYVYKDFSITFNSPNKIIFKDQMPDKKDFGVAAKIINNLCTVYVTSLYEYAEVKVQLLQCTRPGWIKWIQHEKFLENFSTAKITLSTVLENDYITINGVTFTANATATTIASRQFKIDGDNTADASELISCINDATYGVPGVVAANTLNAITLTYTDTIIVSASSTMKVEGVKLEPVADVIVPRTSYDILLSDDTLIVDNGQSETYPYLKIFEITSKNSQIQGSFTLMFSERNNGTTECMFEIVHYKFRIDGGTTKAEISKLSGNSKNSLLPNFAVTYDSTASKVYGYIKHTAAGTRFTMKLVEYDQTEYKSILKLLPSETATDTLDGTTIAITGEEYVVPRTLSELKLSSDTILNKNSVSEANPYLKIFEISPSTGSSTEIAGSFTLLISGRNNGTTECILEIVHYKYKASANKAEISRISGNAVNRLIPEFIISYDSAAKKMYGWVKHTNGGVHTTIRLLDHDQSDSYSNLSLISGEAAVSSVIGTVLYTSANNESITAISSLLLNGWTLDTVIKSRQQKVGDVTTLDLYLLAGTLTDGTELLNLIIYSPFCFPITCKLSGGTYQQAIVSVAASGGKPKIYGIPATTIAIMGTIRYKN